MTPEEIISNVTPFPDSKVSNRHSYIILGKPGSGKTTVASKLADLTRSVLINQEAM
ncbi:hypothetical protein HDU91_001408, partial [Kappamyces sp. JEL0680]